MNFSPSKTESHGREKKVVIGRPINGISLNGLEYLCDNNGKTLKFADEKEAESYLLYIGYTKQEIEDEGIVIKTESLLDAVYSQEDIKHFNEIYNAEQTIDAEQTLVDMLKHMNLSLEAQSNGKYCIIDKFTFLTTEVYKDFDENDMAKIIEQLTAKLSIYGDYYTELEESAKSESKRFNLGQEFPDTAEGWVNFMDEHKDWKGHHEHEYNAMKMISSPELLESVNLDDIASHFNSDIKKEKGKKSISIERD